MIGITFKEPVAQEWVSWQTKCNTETTKLLNAVKNKKKFNIKKDLYKKQKSFYFDKDGPFRGKCVYCEQKLTGNQHGDIEHYRPKKKVTDEDDNTIMISENGKVKPHPGYYWLAYDWKNLLPSCVLCNQASTDTKKGEPIGKRNRFPVNGAYAFEPGKESQEKPLLLHPCWDNPSEHLNIDETGVFGAQTECGEMCIKIFGLNLRGLPEDRKKEYDNIKNQMGLLAQSLIFDPSGLKTRELIDKILKIKNGYGEFTTVALKAIADSKKHLNKLKAL